MKKILIVEDDITFNKLLFYCLADSGYNVMSSHTIREAKDLIDSNQFDLIILDINLPDGNGFDLCQEIKKCWNTTIIFLTANDFERDMLKGFDMGAEDYIVKPFPVKVLQRKLVNLFGHISEQNNNNCYDDSHIHIDFDELSANLDGIPINFTPMEYRMLDILIRNKRKVLTRKLLLEQLWDNDGNFVEENSLTTIISRIRSKIETDNMLYIKTIYGMGYMWIGGKDEA